MLLLLFLGCCCRCYAQFKNIIGNLRRTTVAYADPRDALTTVVKGCVNMWLEFTCKCSRSHTSVTVQLPNIGKLQLSRSNVWVDQKDGRMSLYHNQRNQTVSFFIRNLLDEDHGEYKCVPGESGESEEEQVVEVRRGRGLLLLLHFRYKVIVSHCKVNMITKYCEMFKNSVSSDGFTR